jgi:SPP1 gp7 family putative phage head morphogenesis protein
MADSPLPSDLEAPTDKDELFDWLEEQSVALEAVMAREIRRIVTESVERFIAGLVPDSPEQITAAADFTEFDDIVPEWEDAVARNVRPVVERIHLTGGVAASVTAPGFGAVSATVAANWASVVNQEAVAYAATRTPVLSNIGFAIRQQISIKVAETVQSGVSTEKLAQEIRDLTGVSDYRALTIARTEVNAAYSNGNWIGLNAMDEEFRPVEKVWSSTFDERTRPTHVAINGRVLRWSEPFEFPDGTMMHPRDFSGPASEVVNCRCSMLELYPGMTRPDGTRVPG